MNGASERTFEGARVERVSEPVRDPVRDAVSDPVSESGPRAGPRRAVFLVLVGFTTMLVALLLLQMVRANGVTVLEYPIFLLTLLLLVPITVSFWMAVMGFVVQCRGRDPLGLELENDESRSTRDDEARSPRDDEARSPRDDEARSPRDDEARSTRDDEVGTSRHDAMRTGRLTVPVAIVIPIFNEDPARVSAGIKATRGSLEETGEAAMFDFFVLSDTMAPTPWIEEERAITELRRELPVPTRIHYRNRQRNSGKKAGNIAEFCRMHGDQYRYMIVFDADSVMSGSTLVRLVHLMERHRDVGIIQAPPVPVNRRTFFGRIQQFAARAYGPTWAAGLAYLQGGEGNYYGHNAIIRIAPFMEHCRLPKLPGKAPLGGAVLSHDFVEAALMRRAGYKVHLAADLGGSFEEAPPTLIDFAARDRRWCQGNLQHARLFSMPGIHPVSRLHLLMGVMAYLASPLWILLLALATAEAMRWKFSEHEYFAPGGSLFPTWEISIATQATVLFVIVLAMLFVPRILALIACLREEHGRQSFGGALGLLASGAMECIFSSLLAPTLAFTQSQFVISILCGRSTGWITQARTDRGTTLAEALRRHGGTVLVGIVWAGLLLRFSPQVVGWMLPVLAGLALAVPLSMLTSRVAVGDWARRHRLLLTPEEIEPEPVLRRWRSELAQLSKPETEADAPSALERILSDPVLRASHLEFTESKDVADPLEEHVLQGLVLKCRLQGAAALTDEEQRRLLLAPRAVKELLAESRGASR